MYILILIKLSVAMIGVIFFMRLAGKTQMGMITPLDTVNSFIIGALIGGVIYNPGLSVWLMLFSIFIWALINIAVRQLSKINFINRLINGSSEYLIKKGVLMLGTLKKNNMTMHQLKTKLREQEVFWLLDVDDVRFETNGAITVFRKEDAILSYLLINKGEILKATLRDAKRDEDWLRNEMDKLGFLILKSFFVWNRLLKGDFILLKWMAKSMIKQRKRCPMNLIRTIRFNLFSE